MTDNDNVRDIIAWELPEPIVGKCAQCQITAELIGGLCDDCELALSDAIYRLQHPEEV
jgi:hypothetical protein